MGRSLLLEVRGPAEFRRVVVPAGGTLRIGRTSLAEFVVPEDDRMAQLHWELRWDGSRCEVRDTSGELGTLLGGERITSAAARSGAWIRAGGTDFQVFFEDERPLSPDAGDRWGGGAEVPPALREPAERGKLFAVLDAARTERAVPLLRTAVDEYRCLYEGIDAEAQADGAPYLARIAPGSRLLPRLLAEGWGESWGIFVEAPVPFRELRAHLRKLLVVTRELDGLPMFFRFYDPRVLRVFLSVATPRQVEELFGPVDAFLVEAEAPRAVLRFARGEAGVACERLDAVTGEPTAAG